MDGQSARQIQPFTVDIELYVDIWRNPDPQKIKDLEVETTFYRESDPIIMKARELQRGGDITQTEIDELIENPGASGYATGLRMCLEKIREASQFWRGETDATPDVSQKKVMERANAAAGGKY